MMDMAEQSETVSVPLASLGDVSVGDEVSMEVAEIKGDMAVLKVSDTETEEPPKEDVLGEMANQFNNLPES